jgi:hypothetical protein
MAQQTLSNRPKNYVLLFHLMTEAEPASETSCVFKIG